MRLSAHSPAATGSESANTGPEHSLVRFTHESLRPAGQEAHDVRMTSDAECVEVHVDYGNVSGSVVRLDVEIPPAAPNGRRVEGRRTDGLPTPDP